MRAEGGGDDGMPHGDGATGGGIFALRRPRPYSRALAGRTLRGALRSKCRHLRLPHACAYHAARETHGCYNVAAREGRALAGGRATRGPSLQRRLYAMIWMVYVCGGGRGNLRVAKTPPLQSAFAGMPVRDGRATNVAIASASMPQTVPFMRRRNGQYEWIFIAMRHGKGGHSLRSAPPLPRTQQPISPIDRNVILGSRRA